jgi:Domain of unknown function (DUF4271)
MNRLWVLLTVLFLAHGFGYAQSAANPFELLHRLPQAARVTGEVSKNEPVVSRNPFDLVPHKIPSATQTISTNETRPFEPSTFLPRGNTLPQEGLFGFLTFLLLFFVFSVSSNRAALGKAWRSFLSDTALSLVQREASGFVGITPYYLLYASFLLNAGLFIFLVTRFFAAEKFNNISFLLFCLLLSILAFVSKHILLSVMSFLFPVREEVGRYNFLIIIFNCILGVFLLPCNLMLAFNQEYQILLVFWMLGLVMVFYLYRSFRSSSLTRKFLGTSNFHFLLYLCAVEIAPVFIVIKLASRL